ncbi:DUF2254 domain-containing protein [Paenisporosarcina sp. TG20]|uniref:DUF2254 domain-containing protein n=1 Tax=Paenisporosarcina sp. TG20 TaxID=1211706 RepID=UPI0002FBB1DF|nr:DUF2254 domain-containing protein [Paenisporosarcina sp. TG20]
MERYWLKFKESIWFVPSLYGLLSVILAVIFSAIDLILEDFLLESVPHVILTTVDLAQIILGGLSAALLTMTTFTFSTILVVLTTYSSQFSPRTMKNFVRDPMVWRVLGIFMGGFIYTTLSLLFMQESINGETVISSFVGVLYAMVCLGFFAAFIYHIAQNIQVNKLIEKLAIEGEEAVAGYEKLLKRENLTTNIDGKWSAHPIAHPIIAGQDGYIQLFDIIQLVSLAKKYDGRIEIEFYIGDFVPSGSTVVTLYLKESTEIEENPEKLFTIGRERDTRQDPVFAIQKMVEVSLRSISPGINDPNTAIHNIHQLGRLLGRYSQLPKADLIFMDKENKQRVKLSLHRFDEVLYHTFYQLSHFGQGDVSVLGAMTDSLINAAQLAPIQSKEDIWKIQLYIIESMDKNEIQSLDRQFYQRKIDLLAKLAAKETINLENLVNKSTQRANLL